MSKISRTAWLAFFCLTAAAVTGVPARAADGIVVLNAPRAIEAPLPALAVRWPSAPDAEWKGIGEADVPAAVAAPAAVTPPTPGVVPTIVALPKKNAPEAAPPQAVAKPTAADAAAIVPLLGLPPGKREDRAPRLPATAHDEVLPHHAFNIIECIAGCIGKRNVIVYYAPRVATMPAEAASAAQRSEVTPAAARVAAVAVDPAIIECIAGCYDTPRRYRALPLPQRQAIVPPANDGRASTDTTAPLADVLPERNERRSIGAKADRAPRAKVAQTAARVLSWRSSPRRSWPAQVALAH